MIYITGDLHGGYDIQKLLRVKFNPDDIIIVCGDFGYVFYEDEFLRMEQFKNLHRLMDIIGCTLLFVNGNHENFNRLEKFRKSTKYGGKVQKISDNCYHLMRGETYTINGYKFLCIGGAESHDAHMREYNISMWRQESITKAEIEKAIRNCKDIDFIITHCAPQTFMTRLFCDNYIPSFDITQSVNLLEELYNVLKKQEKPWKWFMGHYHKDLNYDPFYVMYNEFYCIDTGEWL